MLLIKASSSCDACLEPFHLKGESSPAVRAPCVIDCGHIFCAMCIDSFTRLACPLCRSHFNPRAVRRLDIHVAPQTPDIRSARVSRPDNKCATSSKEVLKARIISIVRNGADESHYQAAVEETCAWLKEQTSEEHWDLRALYLLLINYHHQILKDEQEATVSLHEKTKLYQDALRTAKRRQQEIAELKQTIEGLRVGMASKEVKWAVREKQLTTKYDKAIEETRSLRKQLITLPIIEDECPIDLPAPVKPIVNHFSPLPVHRPSTSTPAAYDNRRHENGKEKLQELSWSSSCSTGHIPSSRIRALQEKRVPESGDGAECNRSARQQLLNVSLANAPAPQSSPTSIRTRPPAPIPPPSAPPPMRRPTDISRPNTAAEEIDRERQRHHYQSNQNRSSETPATYVASPRPLPPRPPQVHTQRMGQPRPRVQSLKDAIRAHGAEDSMRCRSVYSERHSASRTATERCIGKPYRDHSP